MGEIANGRDLVEEAAIDWDVESLFQDFAQAYPAFPGDHRVLLSAMLLKVPSHEVLRHLNETPQPSEGAIRKRNSTMYARLMELVGAQEQMYDEDGDSKRLEREMVLHELRENSYWRGRAWQKLMKLPQLTASQRQITINAATPGTRDVAIDPPHMDGIQRILVGSPLQFQVQVQGYDFAYLLHGNERNEVTLVSPSSIAPGPALHKSQRSLRVPDLEVGRPIYADRAGSQDTVLAILLQEEELKELKNSGGPTVLSERQLRDIEGKLRAFAHTTPGWLQVVSTTYHVVRS